MTALDTLRTKVEEAKANLPIALVDRPKAEGPLDALLAAHRALVVAELAGESETETLAKAVDAAVNTGTGCANSYREEVELELEAAAPLLRAPLAAKLAALGDQVRALGGTP